MEPTEFPAARRRRWQTVLLLLAFWSLPGVLNDGTRLRISRSKRDQLTEVLNRG
jgi:hypothetical protein